MSVFVPHLQAGDVLDNPGLASMFGCGTQGGMRRAHKTKSLVLISNHVESIYDDRWIDGVLHYTGMGTEGNQSLDFLQNKTLNESQKNNVSVFLFEVFKAQEYTYIGPVSLAGEPYQETQQDKNKQDRLVWVFPLKLTEGEPVTISDAVASDLLNKKLKAAKRLDDEELRRRAFHRSGKSGQRSVSVSQYDRNPWVAEYTKRRADGHCDLCREPAPFPSKDGTPYLENHHITWLSRGGEDSVLNTVALCPNCHRRMHVLDVDADKALLLKRLKMREAK